MNCYRFKRVKKGVYMINNLGVYQSSVNFNAVGLKKKQTYGPNFRGIQTLTHTNIGSCADGYIGKVKVRLGEGGDAFLNVFKGHNAGCEEYKIMDDFNNLIGEVQLKIKKFFDYDKFEYKSDPSHVFVDNLRNYSKPGTPYYNKNLKYYKDIGTRFLQIAQRRSDEANCCGNIRLISKGESKPFYKDVIHMQEEFPPDSPLRFFNNPNTMYLPPEWKEPLSRLNGGL